MQAAFSWLSDHSFVAVVYHRTSPNIQTNRYKGSYGHMTDSREVVTHLRIMHIIYKYSLIIFSPYVLTPCIQKLWQEEIKPLLLFPWIYIIILVFPAMNR